MHVIKYKMVQAGHILKHCERAKDKNGEYIKFGNKSIDKSRTHLNYNLCPERRGFKFIRKRCGEVNFVDRSNTNVMCSWVVTAPKDLPPEETRKFFETMYKFYCSRYNEENVISAFVHMDEGYPHMHFAFVPVVQDKETGELKVCAREVIDRKELKKIHPAAEKCVSEALGHPVAIMTGELSDRPDLTLEQYRTLKEVEKMLELAQNRHSELTEDINDLERKFDELGAKYGNFEAIEAEAEKKLEELRSQLKTKKGKVTMPAELWEEIGDLQTELRKNRALNSYRTKSLTEAQKALSEAQEQLTKVKISASYLEARNEELIKENLALQNKLARLDYIFTAFPELKKQIEILEKKSYEREIEK